MAFCPLARLPSEQLCLYQGEERVDHFQKDPGPTDQDAEDDGPADEGDEGDAEEQVPHIEVRHCF